MTRILVVEDDDLLRTAFCRQLVGAGHEVSQAGDGISAISTAVQTRPELVLLDLGLPGGNGIVVLERLRNLPATAFVEVIVVTGGMLDYDREQQLAQLGCAAVLTKPVPSADLLAAVARATGAAEAASAAPAMAKVLVVDDNAANRDLVVTLLGYRRHVVTQAANGVEALQSMRADPPDLVITDLRMPVMDGYELIREVRADPALAHTPAIFYTANYQQDEVRPIAAALGIKHVVSKPVEPQHLLAVVDDALAGAGAPVPPVRKQAY